MSGDDARNWPVVGLVASAGGVEALLSVLGGLPADLPAAFIVALHSGPGRESTLAELLARRCALSVEWAADGEELRPGRVLVIPPGVHGVVRADETLALVEAGVTPPSRPSGDLLLTTMASALGPRAIAVVLSGSGHDGATGATAVHHLGGTVFAATGASSAVASMPDATAERDDAADHVLPAHEIAAALVERFTGTAGRS